MGVIRKKTATRGGEGGVKYVCDVCSADITSTVSKDKLPFPLPSKHHTHSSPGPDKMRPQLMQRLRSLRTMFLPRRVKP